MLPRCHARPLARFMQYLHDRESTRLTKIIRCRAGKLIEVVASSVGREWTPNRAQDAIIAMASTIWRGSSPPHGCEASRSTPRFCHGGRRVGGKPASTSIGKNPSAVLPGCPVIADSNSSRLPGWTFGRRRRGQLGGSLRRFFVSSSRPLRDSGPDSPQPPTSAPARDVKHASAKGLRRVACARFSTMGTRSLMIERATTRASRRDAVRRSRCTICHPRGS